ncbi:ArsR/SmtB family transcription factor [Paenibacillus hexagrammi]|uniref:Helix-turn-helix domain-containing protein n=1 Tax=Paenibacillus hexagrammi TaxID=2908839 RepID=A0ABY3SG91_9BACL|nr:helix-turn-helix domain-containing protein [Paenibacillus sp. YPD9-1]UJF32473.1 helix-turn-helix domain-containing protein [Paenibacillus sp. YPD9-1]
MKADITTGSLPLFEALASSVRIQILHLLAEREMNIKELAEALQLSSAIMTMHVKKLEKAKLIKTAIMPGRGGQQKLCSINPEMSKIELYLPQKDKSAIREHTHIEIPIGHYTDIEVNPTCGLATVSKLIGNFDDSRSFLSPERVNAKILWIGSGYVEYKIPNYLIASENPVELEISLELASEAPSVNNDWPSDISFYLNQQYLGQWTSPGDFGGTQRGRYTPDWWSSALNQFGLLKMFKINKDGTFLDGQKLSDVTLGDLDIRQKQWTLRIAVLPDAKHVGGLTLFGSGFGNYNQDIVVKLYKETKE